MLIGTTDRTSTLAVLLLDRIIEAKEARRSGNLKTAEQLRAEFEIEGLL